MIRQALLIAVLLFAVATLSLAQGAPTPPCGMCQRSGGCEGGLCSGGETMAAAPAGADAPAGSMPMMMQGPMMRMMGALDLAAGGGKVYLLKGVSLSVLDSNLTPAKTVQLPDMGPMMKTMEDAGVCPMCGRMRERACRSTEGQPGPGGGPPGRHGMMMGGMRMGMMMGMVKLAADNQGVYVLRGMMLYHYDQNLNLVKSSQVMDMKTEMAPAALQGCLAMMKESMGQCSACGHMGSMGKPLGSCAESATCRQGFGKEEGWGPARYLSLPCGRVGLSWALESGRLGASRAKLLVLDDAGRPIGSASVQVWLRTRAGLSSSYPQPVKPLRPGVFEALVTPPANSQGPYELEVVVSAADQPRQSVRFTMP